jgi:hypothetical protein
LRLSHEQRALQHQSALNLVLEFERAGKALRENLQRLRDAKIDFVVIGGYAAILHGSTMVTRDLAIRAKMAAQKHD